MIEHPTGTLKGYQFRPARIWAVRIHAVVFAETSRTDPLGETAIGAYMITLGEHRKIPVSVEFCRRWEPVPDGYYCSIEGHALFMPAHIFEAITCKLGDL